MTPKFYTAQRVVILLMALSLTACEGEPEPESQTAIGFIRQALGLGTQPSAGDGLGKAPTGGDGLGRMSGGQPSGNGAAPSGPRGGLGNTPGETPAEGGPSRGDSSGGRSSGGGSLGDGPSNGNSNSCGPFCDKAVECEFIGPSEADQCLDTCQNGLDENPNEVSALIACVLTTSCSDLEDVCLSGGDETGPAPSEGSASQDDPDREDEPSRDGPDEDGSRD